MDDISRKFQRDLNTGLVGFVLLGVLEASNEDLYGYDIAKRLQEGREGESIFKEGSLYPVLRALAAKGWLASRIVPSYSGPPRRYYRITAAGRVVLANWRAVWSDTRDFVERFAAQAVDSPRDAT
ncbi:MAG: helix-turn-helix transcriptional regulator [Gammaproteobacteria bacterium]|nr:helix-turn-helix transcriptional regulator [Gammaproteobacteria bacterium]MBM4209818.1 helix-turn-helix transcriptional regulator [Gammaproteobacteria bacterium]